MRVIIAIWAALLTLAGIAEVIHHLWLVLAVVALLAVVRHVHRHGLTARRSRPDVGQTRPTMTRTARKTAGMRALSPECATGEHVFCRGCGCDCGHTPASVVARSEADYNSEAPF